MTPNATRVAALYDIHGNLPALQAVLRDVEQAGADLIVFGGDLAWGPWPVETVDAIRSMERAVVIRGNADRETGGRFDESDGLAAEVAEITIWAADLLGDERCRWLKELRETATVEIEGLGPTLFCHGSPRSDEESLTSLSSEARLTEVLENVDDPFVLCGHTHIQFDRTVGNVRLINAGSVGLAYERAPGAYWALLDEKDGISLRRTTYDTAETAQAMRATACPHVDEMFATNIEHPPDPEEVAAHFEKTATADG